jgi:hypothetical protein
LLRDGMTQPQRVAIETYRDARTAMALIREAVEDCAPPGSVAREGYLTPEFTVQAEALVRGIYATCGRSRRRSNKHNSIFLSRLRRGWVDFDPDARKNPYATV